jgi:serine/threonine protein kinase
MPDNDESLGDQQTYVGGAQPADSSDRSLGDQSTFGGGGESSLSDIGGLTGDAELDMEIVDLSRYEVQETLGKGGMGEVLLATDTRLNRKVAIKRMLGDAAKSQTAVRRFLTEAQSIAALNHFNIVQIYDYGRDKDGPFLIMEYVDGGSLLDKCREGALPLEEAVELTCQLCDGLEMAHDAGIIHRDIKPANVLLTSRGEPKLTDFGLARQDTGDTGQTMAGAVLGTLDFMPPEQRRDATQTDNRSDLWSLAATLYQLVTGEPPRVIDLDEVPQELRTTLSKALKTKPDARYQTAREFKDALRATTQTASQPIQEPAAELGAGECPKCHTKNEASRKFCQGCGSSLQLSCLSCDEQIPVCDNFCSECGGKQSELAASKLEEFARQRDQAEEYRREYRFEDALQIARSLASIEDERIAEHVPWAEEFVTATEAEWERERESAAAHFKEARKHRDAFDYASAIHAVESVPEAMRTSEVSGYLEHLERDRAESEELIKTISDRVKRRDLDGLLDQVDRAVELRGDRTDLHKLVGQLRERKAKLQIQLSTLATTETQPGPSHAAAPATQNRDISLERLERDHILATLERTKWNKSQAAQILGIERSTLDRKLKRYDVKRPAKN